MLSFYSRQIIYNHYSFLYLISNIAYYPKYLCFTTIVYFFMKNRAVWLGFWVFLQNK